MTSQFIRGFAEDQQKQEALSIDPNMLLSHHLMIIGATGSGKSTSLLSLINAMQTLKQTNVVFDATGEFSDIPNAVHYKLGENANLDFANLTVSEVASLLSIHTPMLIEKLAQAIESLKIQKNIVKETGILNKVNKSIKTFDNERRQLRSYATDYDALLITEQIIQEFSVPYSDAQADYQLLGQELDTLAIRQLWSEILNVKNVLNAPDFKRLFNLHQSRLLSAHLTTQTDLFYVLKLFSEKDSQNKTLVIDVSAIPADSATSRLILSILLKQLITLRTTSQQRLPITIYLDEAHRYMPEAYQSLTDSGIFKVLREGRKYGIYAVVSTQSPLDIPAQLRGQFGSLLVHQLNDSEELTALISNHKFNQARVRDLEIGAGFLKLFNHEPVAVNISASHIKHETQSPRFR